MNNNNFNDLIVVKRSGQRVSFNGLKIAIAIKSAFDGTMNNYSPKEPNSVYLEVLDYIRINYHDRKTINVEDIQNIIEDKLKSKYNDVYVHFRTYRLKRTELRNVFATKQQHKFVKALEKIEGMDNSIYSPKDVLKKLNDTISLEYAKAYVVDSKYIRSSNEGRMFIHNLPLFYTGLFNDVHLNLKSDNNDFFYDITNRLINYKSEVNGEICVNDFDLLLADNLLYMFREKFKNIFKDYIEFKGYKNYIDTDKISEIIESINTININGEIFKYLLLNQETMSIFDYAYNKTMTIIKKDFTDNLYHMFLTLDNYDMFSFSMSLSDTYEHAFIEKIMVDVLLKNKHLKNVSFIYKVKENMPTFIMTSILKLIMLGGNLSLNIVNKYCDMEYPEYFSSGLLIYDNVLGSSSSHGRINVANTSINLARVALNHNKMDLDFFRELDELLEFTKNQLLFIFEMLGNRLKKSYKYLFDGVLIDSNKIDDSQKIRKVIKNGTLNINLIGLYECSRLINPTSLEETMNNLSIYISNKVSKMASENKLNITLSAINYLEDSHYLSNIDRMVYKSVPSRENYVDPLTISRGKESVQEKMLECYNGGVLEKLVINKNIKEDKLEKILLAISKRDNGFVKVVMNNDN